MRPFHPSLSATTVITAGSADRSLGILAGTQGDWPRALEHLDLALATERRMRAKAAGRTVLWDIGGVHPIGPAGDLAPGAPAVATGASPWSPGRRGARNARGDPTAAKDPASGASLTRSRVDPNIR